VNNILTTELDLSFNRITGQFNDAKISTNMSTTRLKVNRLSGKLPVEDLSLSTDLNILLGNIFACGDLPSNDEHYEDYTCGSRILNASLTLLTTTAGCILVLFGIVAWVCCNRGSTLTESDKLSSGRYDFQQLTLWKRIITLARNQRSYFTVMTTLQSSVPPIRNANHIIRFYFELITLTKLWVILCLLSIVLSIPIFVLKSVDSEATTHDFLYSWKMSWVYTTGETSALLLLSAWLCLICSFILVVVFMLWIFNSHKVQHKRQSELENLDPLSRRIDSLDKEENSLTELWNFKTGLLLITNNMIVVGVNLLYIYSTTQYIRNFYYLLIQLAVAAFKQINSTFVLPYLCRPIKDPKNSLRVRLKISILQTLFVPCLVTAFQDPSCLRVSVCAGSIT
jgi:hypothetical protein